MPKPIRRKKQQPIRRRTYDTQVVDPTQEELDAADVLNHALAYNLLGMGTEKPVADTRYGRYVQRKLADAVNMHNEVMRDRMAFEDGDDMNPYRNNIGIVYGDIPAAMRDRDVVRFDMADDMSPNYRQIAFEGDDGDLYYEPMVDAAHGYLEDALGSRRAERLYERIGKQEERRANRRRGRAQLADSNDGGSTTTGGGGGRNRGGGGGGRNRGGGGGGRTRGRGKANRFRDQSKAFNRFLRNSGNILRAVGRGIGQTARNIKKRCNTPASCRRGGASRNW